MFSENFIKALEDEGVVSIVTWANNDAHVANTWNSYLITENNDTIYIPVYGMRKTEENININDKVKLTLGSKNVQGYQAMGTGFLIEGIASFINEGESVDLLKSKYVWCRHVLKIKVTSLKQTV